MENKEMKKLEEFLINNCNISIGTIRLFYDINGYKIETLQDILFAKTGYRSLDQID